MPETTTPNTEANRAPALRISHIVRGRVNVEGRVRYLVDPLGQGDERAIPEDVVLSRWRRRTMAGHSFHGCRLGPNIWRAINEAFGMDSQVMMQLDATEVARRRELLHAKTQQHHLRLPDATALVALWECLGPERLQALLVRHLSPERATRFGTPDLFLFARQSETGRCAFYRLVEVKKPREHISQDQHEEVYFLRSMGVPARVLRLIER